MEGKRKQPAITTFFVKKPRQELDDYDKARSIESDPGPRPQPVTLREKQEQAALEWCSLNKIPDKAEECSAGDFVRRDPAHRPPNLFFVKQLVFDPQLLRDVIQSYVRLGPYQPQLKQYPAREIGGCMRAFQSQWFEKKSWLEYSPSTDAVYCLCCYLSREVMTQQSELTVYAQPTAGYRNWKKATTKDGFAKHVGTKISSKHHSALIDFDNRRSCQNDIGVALNSQKIGGRQQNRERLTFILEICLLLAKQEIAFRGSDEKDTSQNKGNFLEIVQFVAQHAPSFSRAMSLAGENAVYTSPQIQRELIKCAADVVRKHIMEVEIADGYFSVLVDEASCMAKKEHMAIVIRFVCAATGTIKERFFGTVHVRDTNAGTLYDGLITQLEKWGLLLANCRGQGYDGASNMSGDFTGLQRRLRSQCPYAYYVHCFAHRLNLVLVAVTMSTVSVVQCFDTVQGIHTTVGASCKRKDQLLDEAAVELKKMLDQGQLESGRGLNQPTSTEGLSKTRWNCHIRALRKVKMLWAPITSVLERVVVDGVSPHKRAEASGILEKMWTFDFVFHMEILTAVLGKTNRLSQFLQKDDVDVVSAVNMTKQISKELKEMLDDSSMTRSSPSFESIWNSSVNFCKSIQVDDSPVIPDKNDAWKRRGMRSRGCGRSGIPGADSSRDAVQPTQEAHYRDEVYKCILRDLISEMDSRFSGEVLSLMELCGSLSPRDNFKNWSATKIVELAETFYPDDFTGELDDLREEATRFRNLATIDKRFQNLKTTQQLCIQLVGTDNNELFPTLHRIVNLVCVLPVTTATTERSFSAMKRIKTRLRTTMGDLWMSNLMVLAIERDLTNSIDKDSVLDTFKGMTKRRIEI